MRVMFCLSNVIAYLVKGCVRMCFKDEAAQCVLVRFVLCLYLM
jgi:hypothetical protein